MRILMLAALLGAQADHWRPLETSLPDAAVITEDGIRRKFHSDLVKDRTVAVQFIFTSCTTSCPVQVAVFAQLQRRMPTARLISVTVDPDRDTPEALRKFAERFGGRPGANWRLVTGRGTEIRSLLRALEPSGGMRGDHSRGVWVHDGRRNEWSWTQASASVAAVERLLREAEDRP